MTSISKIFLGFLILFISSFQLTAQGGRIPVSAEKGMVVSSHYLASEVGRDILAQGGTAVDASIATAFALSVTLPSAGNIGGGGFLVYYGGDAETTTFNFREKAPLAATREMYLDENGEIKNNSNHEGLLSVGVPGTVAGLYKAHQKFGKLEWSELVQPAIEIAENGFPVSPHLVGFSNWVLENEDEYPSTAEVFLKNGEALESGDILIQKDLAETLKRIRDKGGVEGFYQGKTASLIADFMKSNGGIITKKDLKVYEAEEMEPITGTYRGYDIIGMAPPSSGGVAIVEMLNILEAYDLKEKKHNSAESLHFITEAMRRAYADRAQFLGDLNFNEQVPLDKLTSKEYAEMLADQIQENIASKSDSANFNKAHLVYESPQTTHLSVVDSEGNAVSLTYTLEQSYGSKIVVKGAGFLLNNEMGDFNAIPGYTDTKGRIGTKPNQIEPGKRMLSSMSPTIVAKDGKPVIVIGSPGGRTIINTVLQVILNMVDYDMNIAKAIESPRFHHQWLPDVTYFEEWGFSPDTQRIYYEMGHEFKIRESQGRAMGIYLDHETGIIEAAADSRSYDGRAVGY
ncbi:gamma-glutamyltransferase [Christiangramia forsetii]|uniref:Glutathione hydrolase proenzyme n=2 Tax=Christiangramia forsetii TaxID=411153 RepID=A0M2S5_CHRFK|nr:gamma-glutamyltransferase [Christiangramia forsetii]GGG44487.1 gamma-glutamyltransferase [Christiangramia forsetii]CAL66920.1 gamma-glutamyltranspeptidase [Christiangramia forsetii KT0803]